MCSADVRNTLSASLVVAAVVGVADSALVSTSDPGVAGVFVELGVK